MMDFLRDLRLGFRLLLRAPGFAATAILTLALGIGATTALFTVVNAVLLEPLPFPDSNKLIQVWRSELPALTYGSASYPRYLDWRQHQRVFTDLGAWSPRGFTIAGPQGPERAPGAMASASFFGVMGAPPVIGRYFSDRRGSAGRRARRGDQRRLVAAAVSTVAVGARATRCRSTAQPTPSSASRRPVSRKCGGSMSGFRSVRLPTRRTAAAIFCCRLAGCAKAMTLDAARRGLADLAAQMSRDNAIDKYTFTARPLHEVITENATRGLWMLLAATSLLLLIACTNVANLLLARAVVRERDLAIRASLGAGRRRLFGQVMGETIALGRARQRGRHRPRVGRCCASSSRWRRRTSRGWPRFTLDTSVLGFSLIVAVVARLDRRPRAGDSLAALRSQQRDSRRRQPRRHRRPCAIGEPRCS